MMNQMATSQQRVICWSVFHVEKVCFIILYLSLFTHADRQGVDILVTVCFFVSVCTVTDFSTKDKVSGVIFCTAVHRRPMQGISNFCELFSHRKPKSYKTAGARATPTRM